MAMAAFITFTAFANRCSRFCEHRDSSSFFDLCACFGPLVASRGDEFESRHDDGDEGEEEEGEAEGEEATDEARDE